MKQKQRSICLTARPMPASEFRVHSITNSMEFRPGQYLNSAQVQELCMAPEWQVKIIRVPRGSPGHEDSAPRSATTAVGAEGPAGTSPKSPPAGLRALKEQAQIRRLKEMLEERKKQ